MKVSNYIKVRNIYSICCFLMISSDGYAVKTTFHEIDATMNYQQKRQNPIKIGSNSFISPSKPVQNRLQYIEEIHEEHLSLMPEEESLLIPGIDRRQQITTTEKWPNSIHGQLSMQYSTGKFGGSGVSVGPHHILTAAHNVYNYENKEWAQSIFVRLGLHENMAPFGEVKAVKVYTFTKWVENKNPQYDIALITLDHSIGHETGWAGLFCLDDETLSKKEITITGYPGDKGLKQMWTMSDKIGLIELEKFYYDIDTYKGQSGSGILINIDSSSDDLISPYVVGIHTNGGTVNTGNSGVRLSENKFKTIVDWMSESYIIESNETPSNNVNAFLRGPIFLSMPSKQEKKLEKELNKIVRSEMRFIEDSEEKKEKIIPKMQDKIKEVCNSRKKWKDFLEEERKLLQSNEKYKKKGISSEKRNDQISQMGREGIYTAVDINLGGNLQLLKHQFDSKNKILEESYKLENEVKKEITQIKDGIYKNYVTRMVDTFDNHYVKAKEIPSRVMKKEKKEGKKEKKERIKFNEKFNDTLSIFNHNRWKRLADEERATEINDFKDRGVDLRHRLTPTCNLVRATSVIKNMDEAIETGIPLGVVLEYLRQTENSSEEDYSDEEQGAIRAPDQIEIEDPSDEEAHA